MRGLACHYIIRCIMHAGVVPAQQQQQLQQQHQHHKPLQRGPESLVIAILSQKGAKKVLSGTSPLPGGR